MIVKIKAIILYNGFPGVFCTEVNLANVPSDIYE